MADHPKTLCPSLSPQFWGRYHPILYHTPQLLQSQQVLLVPWGLGPMGPLLLLAVGVYKVVNRGGSLDPTVRRDGQLLTSSLPWFSHLDYLEMKILMAF